VRVQQAALGRHDDALAVALDRATLEHQPRRKPPQAEPLGNLSRHAIVLVEGRVLVAPRVVFPIDQGLRTVRSLDERRTVVADPRVVRFNFNQLDIGRTPDMLAGAGERCFAAAEQPYRLVARHDANKLPEDGWNDFKLTRPRV